MVVSPCRGDRPGGRPRVDEAKVNGITELHDSCQQMGGFGERLARD